MPLRPDKPATQEWHQEHQAVILTYIMRDPNHDQDLKDRDLANVGFVLVLPENDIFAPIQFSVEDASNPGAITIEASK